MGEVLSRAELVTPRRARTRRRPHIAFANGCFDLLHVGHVRYLERRPREADVLVVADQRRRVGAGVEGAGRPILPRRRSRRAGGGAALRGLRGDLPRADRRRRCSKRCGRTCTARAPTTPSNRCPSARSSRPTAAARRSSAIRRTTPRATLLSRADRRRPARAVRAAASSSSAWARSATSIHAIPWRRRCAPRFPRRRSTGWSIRAMSSCSTWSLPSIGDRVARAIPAPGAMRCCATLRELRAVRLRRGHRSPGAAEVGDAGAEAGAGADDRISAGAPARAAGARCSTPTRPIPASDARRSTRTSRCWRRWVRDRRAPVSAEHSAARRPSSRSRRASARAAIALINPGRGVAEQALAGRALRRGGRGDSRATSACGRSCCGGRASRSLRSGRRRGVAGRRGAGAADDDRRTCSASPRGARLMISGDTGPLHIAGAVGTPIVALFGPTQAGAQRTVEPARHRRCRASIGARASTAASAGAATPLHRRHRRRRGDGGGGRRLAAGACAGELTGRRGTVRARATAGRARIRAALRSCCARAADVASLAAGLVVALVGEAIRMWAAGHLEKSREVTASGPYRWTRHPLYVGSAIMALGVVIASRS